MGTACHLTCGLGDYCGPRRSKRDTRLPAEPGQELEEVADFNGFLIPRASISATQARVIERLSGFNGLIKIFLEAAEYLADLLWLAQVGYSVGDGVMIF